MMMMRLYYDKDGTYGSGVHGEGARGESSVLSILSYVQHT